MITFAFLQKWYKIGFKIECTVMSISYNYRLKRIITVKNKKWEFATNNQGSS